VDLERLLDRIRRGENRAQQVVLLRSLCDTMTHGSLCAMGAMTPYPVLSALDHYGSDFGLAPEGAVQPLPGTGPVI
jgi:formate dehydrogenase iron-sulfur subunit